MGIVLISWFSRRQVVEVRSSIGCWCLLVLVKSFVVFAKKSHYLNLDRLFSTVAM